jgi:hypothetical protein
MRRVRGVRGSATCHVTVRAQHRMPQSDVSTWMQTVTIIFVRAIMSDSFSLCLLILCFPRTNM